MLMPDRMDLPDPILLRRRCRVVHQTHLWSSLPVSHHDVAVQVGQQGVSADALGFSIRYAGEQDGRAVGDRERIVESRVGVLGRCVEY
jgi:hypothetical protein